MYRNKWRFDNSKRKNNKEGGRGGNRRLFGKVRSHKSVGRVRDDVDEMEAQKEPRRP